ncbi:MAG: hypothetical protein ACP5IA_03050 [Sediminispirochaetaceae bacterium]
MKTSRITMSRIMLMTLTILVLLPAAGWTMGKKEAPGKGVIQTEEERKIVFYMLLEDPAGAQVSAGIRPEAAGLYHLFQDVRVSGGAVRIASSRELSLPIAEKKILDPVGAIGIERYEAELVPLDPLRYRKKWEAEFSFSVDELISGGRVRMQPGQKALIDAARAAGVDGALMRVEKISFDRDGIFSGIVEIAEPAE